MNQATARRWSGRRAAYHQPFSAASMVVVASCERGGVAAGVEERDGGDLGIEGAMAELFVTGDQGAAAGGVDEHASVQDLFSIRRLGRDQPGCAVCVRWR